MRFDLASEWSLSCGRNDIPEIPIQLPGDNYSALLASGLIPDPCIGLNENAVQWVHECDWTFAKEFELEPEENSVGIHTKVFPEFVCAVPVYLGTIRIDIISDPKSEYGSAAAYLSVLPTHREPYPE